MDYRYDTGTSVYSGLSSLDYRVAAGSIGPQGTIPHAPISAAPSPVVNVPTTGLPAQPRGYGPVTVAPALNPRNTNVNAGGGFASNVAYSPFNLPVGRLNARNTNVRANGGIAGYGPTYFPPARGTPVQRPRQSGLGFGWYPVARPQNWINHPAV